MRRYARLGAYVASFTLAVTGVTAISPSAQAVTYDPAAKQAAASWLAGQLSSNGLFGGTCSFDCGNDIDAGLSLMDIGTQGATVTSMKSHLPGHVLDYIAGDGFGDTGSTYAGPTAKSLAFAVATGLDPTSYGGVNLRTRLEAQVKSGGATDGRLFDTSTFGDFANTLGQAFAVSGLAAVGSTRAGAVRDFLLEQQCPAGYFRQDFSAVGAADQGCSSADDPSIDATATAVIQLSKLSPTGPVTTAISKARAWLASVQNCDGSFGSGDLGKNANATGLAATALGSSVASRQAAIWLNGHQAKTGDAAAAADAGAIALNDADHASGHTSPIATADRGRWQRATAQAAPGLDYFSTDATPSITMSAVAGYRKAGARQGFTVTGAEPGTVVCLGASRSIATASGAGVVATLPAGTGRRLLTARDGFGNTAGSYVNVLGARTLPVTKAKYRVKRSRFLTVTIYGLAPGEAASIKFRGWLKAYGTADSAGHFRHAIWTGRKRGKGVVAGYGQFGDIRKGYTKIKVVR